MTDKLYFSRDTKVYVNIGSNVWEIPVLDGFSFSQATNSAEITLNEMSDTNGNSRRGRQMFNTSLAPAEWSFQTYARPFKSAGGSAAGRANNSSEHHAVEEVLWALTVGNAQYSSSVTNSGSVATIDGILKPTAIGAGTRGNYDSATHTFSTQTSGNGTGAKLDIAYDNTTGAFTVSVTSGQGGIDYQEDDVLNISREQVSSAFGIPVADISRDFVADVDTLTSGSSSTTFTGFTRDGTNLDINFNSANKSTLGTADFYFVIGADKGANNTKVYQVKDCCVNEASIDFDIDGITTINWSGNGSTVKDVTGTTIAAAGLASTGVITPTIDEGVSSTQNFIKNRLTELAISSSTYTTGGQAYEVVLTSGSITISNNITYLTPETLGVVNTPLGHVTGTLSISGSFSCYLNGEDNASSELFKDMSGDTSKVSNSFNLAFTIGGSGNTPRIEMTMPQCQLEVPTHSIEDIISLDVNFHALPSAVDANPDELAITYTGALLS